MPAVVFVGEGREEKDTGSHAEGQVQTLPRGEGRGNEGRGKSIQRPKSVVDVMSPV